MKKITKQIIEKFKTYLINEEKSSATIEKYIRDVEAGAKSCHFMMYHPRIIE